MAQTKTPGDARRAILDVLAWTKTKAGHSLPVGSIIAKLVHTFEFTSQEVVDGVDLMAGQGEVEERDGQHFLTEIGYAAI